MIMFKLVSDNGDFESQPLSGEDRLALAQKLVGFVNRQDVPSINVALPDDVLPGFDNDAPYLYTMVGRKADGMLHVKTTLSYGYGAPVSDIEISTAENEENAPYDHKQEIEWLAGQLDWHFSRVFTLSCSHPWIDTRTLSFRREETK